MYLVVLLLVLACAVCQHAVSVDKSARRYTSSSSLLH